MTFWRGALVGLGIVVLVGLYLFFPPSQDKEAPKTTTEGYSENAQMPNELPKTPTPEPLIQPSTSAMRMLPEQKDLARDFTKAVIHTSKGDISVTFYGGESPVTVNNFMNLAQNGFYNGTTFHRVIPDFMIQGGDPLSKDSANRRMHGTGGPGYKFVDEFNTKPLIKGSLAMANSGSNTNGSQFFIVTAEATPWLDGKHTNFGYVTKGMDIVSAISGVEVDPYDNPLEAITITGIDLIP